MFNFNLISSTLLGIEFKVKNCLNIVFKLNSLVGGFFYVESPDGDTFVILLALFYFTNLIDLDINELFIINLYEFNDLETWLET